VVRAGPHFIHSPPTGVVVVVDGVALRVIARERSGKSGSAQAYAVLVIAVIN